MQSCTETKRGRSLIQHVTFANSKLESVEEAIDPKSGSSGSSEQHGAISTSIENHAQLTRALAQFPANVTSTWTGLASSASANTSFLDSGLIEEAETVSVEPMLESAVQPETTKDMPSILKGRLQDQRILRIQQRLPADIGSESLDAIGAPSWKIRPRDNPCLYAAWETPECVGVVQDEESSKHFVKRRAAIYVALCAIVAFFAMFDQLHGWSINFLETQGHQPQAVKIFQVVSKQLMVLGVVSCLLAVFEHLGIFDFLSDLSLQVTGSRQYLFNSTTIPADQPPDIRFGVHHLELTGVYETLEVLIGFVMVILVVHGIMMVAFLKRMADTWARAEHELIEENGSLGVTLGTRIELHKENKSSFVFAQLYQQQARYLMYRSEFLYPSGADALVGVNVETFSFYQYIVLIFGEQLVSQVDFPLWCHIVLIVLLSLFRPLLSVYYYRAVAALVGCLFVICLVVLIIENKLRWIESQILPTPRQIQEKDESAHDKVSMEELKTLKRYKAVPAADYCRMVTLRDLLCGTTSPSNFEQLFWFHRRGPAFIFNCLKVCLLFTTILQAELAFHVVHNPYTWLKCSWVYLVLVALQTLWMISYVNSFIKAVMVTSTDLMPDFEVIESINASNWRNNEDNHRTMLAGLKVKAVQHSVRCQAKNGFLEWAQLFERLPQADKAKIEERWRFSQSKQPRNNTAEGQQAGQDLSIGQLREAMLRMGKIWARSADQMTFHKWTECIMDGAAHRQINETRFKVLFTAVYYASSEPLREADAVEVLKARLHVISTYFDTDKRKRRSCFDAAAVEDLFYFIGKSKCDVLGLPPHAQANALLRAVHLCVNSQCDIKSDTMPEDWEAKPEDLVRFFVADDNIYHQWLVLDERRMKGSRSS